MIVLLYSPVLYCLALAVVSAAIDMPSDTALVSWSLAVFAIGFFALWSIFVALRVWYTRRAA